ncbi:C-C motif chemokine 25 [Nannospalax galili]|uniref:C-C motif chemokine 25 n=1 Tax=Nannospalax galili TaxID=1026970 RepID=UPI0004ED3E59|nr:C-C motif chemokine 25 [Nannospalax galili]
MKLWPFACLVACFVGAWVPTVHAQGAIEDCCLGYQRNTKWHILRRATRYRDQLVSGSCNLRAVIFYFRMNKVVCGNPQDKDVQRAMNILSARKKFDNSNSSPALQAERKKQNHERSKVKNPSIRVRNATMNHSR